MLCVVVFSINGNLCTRKRIRLRALALGGSGHLRATMTLQLVDISRVESPL
jgi:hypothetical protein